MKGIEMYAKIQELKELGMSQNAVAAQLGINRTVRHYWKMSADEYNKYCCSIRRISILDQYKSIIAGWIMRLPNGIVSFSSNETFVTDAVSVANPSDRFSVEVISPSFDGSITIPISKFSALWTE